VDVLATDRCWYADALQRRCKINFKALESDQKLRGGYYTPLPVAEFLSDWAITPTTRAVLEPSCGDGRFLEALSNVFSRNRKIEHTVSVEAVELLEDQAELANQKAQGLSSEILEARVYCDDFFSWILNVPMEKTWDAIVGNPPYIRYQYFDKKQRYLAEEIFRRANVKFTLLTNAWVPFVVGSIMHLAPDGRIAMVIPPEISYIIHAHGLRQLLEQELGYMRLVHLRDIVFDGTLQGTVLFLGIKRSGRPFWPLESQSTTECGLFCEPPNGKAVDFAVCDIDSIDDLNAIGSKELAARYSTGPSFSGQWMLAILDDQERSLLSHISTADTVRCFSELADITVGIVTGANKYFCVDKPTVERYRLSGIARPMLARSDLIRGITYTADDHERNASRGRSVFFLEFPPLSKNQMPKQMQDYVDLGESQELHTRYKCRIREPWYCVPYVWVSEVAMLKRCHHYPRLVLNTLGAYSTDTAYRITLKDQYARRAKDLAFCFINSYTLLLAELGGRHYAGGVLELVPSEIRQLRVPVVPVAEGDFQTLDRLIRDERDIDEILDFTDRMILTKGLKLPCEKVERLRRCYKRVRRRRQRWSEH
jgi:adenine-specific DNA methylase